MENSDWRPWRSDWEEVKSGSGCVLCRLAGVEEDDHGVRVMVGEYADGYLLRDGSIPGYCIAVCKLGHVTEPAEIEGDRQIGGYFAEVTRLGRAVARVFRPAKMNYSTLGNRVPHLHTHVVPRPDPDPAPNAPLPWHYLTEGRHPAADIAVGAERLRAELGQ